MYVFYNGFHLHVSREMIFVRYGRYAELDKLSTFASKDHAIGFGDARIMHATGMAPVLVKPDFNAVNGGEMRLYDVKVAFERTSIKKRRENFTCNNQHL